MRKFMLGGLFAAVCATTAFAKDFPYDALLTQRYYTNSTTLASYDLVEVPAVDGGMQESENVAVITMVNAVVTALDEDGWTESTNKLTDIQAAFTLKSVSDDSDEYVWMGYTGGKWEEFDNETVGATPGTYTIKIEIDYTLTPPKVRYSVGDNVMTLKTGGDSWVALGMSATAVDKVQLCGYGTTGKVEGNAGARPASGSATVVEDVGMRYDSMTLNITHSDECYGVDAVKVTLRGGDSSVKTVTQRFADEGPNKIVFGSEDVKPGIAYTYEVRLVKDGGGASIPADGKSHRVNMFSSSNWFYFNSETDEFVNATTNGNVVVDNHKFKVADEEAEGTITPTDHPENVGVVVDTDIEVTSVVTELPAFEAGEEPQFAIALGGTTSDRRWKYYDGVAKMWKDGQAGLPTEFVTYAGRATFDYVAKKVRYEIRRAELVDNDYQLLAETALPSDKSELAAVGITGGGCVSSFSAECKLAEPDPTAVTVDDTKKEIELRQNGEVDLKNLTAGSDPYTVTSAAGKNCHLKWKDNGSKFAVMSDNKLKVCEGTPANGLASYDSYVLGLNAEESTSKPAAVVVAGQNQTGGVVVNVPNLKGKTRPELGYTIKLRVMESTNGTDWEPVSGGSDHDVDADVTVPLFDDSGKRYRVDTIIK